MGRDYRLSSYCILTDLDNESENICMIHGYTGAIDIIDKSIAIFLKANATFDKGAIPCSAATKEALERRGYITVKSREEETEYVKRLANALFKKSMLLRSGFTVVVSYDCNFRCPYCFENSIKRETATFSHEMVDKLYETIEKLSSNNQRIRTDNITLYGGEPLMKQNKDAVTYLVKQGMERGFTFSAITNGYDLDCFEALLSPNAIKFVQITIDGIPERHNKRRIHAQGVPTFDKIVNNIGMALRHGVKVSVRVNTDSDNIEDLKALNGIFSKLHYTENDLFSMYSALLRDYSTNGKETYRYLNQAEYIKKLQAMKMESACKDYGLSRKIQNAVKNNKPIDLTSIYCPAQTKGFVLDPIGKIYPCWEVVNQKQHCLGDYNSDEIRWNQNVIDSWRKCRMLEDDCIKCKYALLCSGGCPASRQKSNKCVKMDDIIQFSVNKAIMACN